MDVIAVKDYPRTQYSAYWEIAIDQKTYTWVARIYSWDSGAVVAEQQGAAPGMEAARHASQTWVKQQMDNYARPGPVAA